MKEKEVFDDDLLPDDSESCGDLMVDGGSLDMAAVDAEEAGSDSPGADVPLTTGPVPLSKADKRWLRERGFAIHCSDDEIQPIRLGGRRVLQLRTTRHAPGGDDEEFKKEPQEPIAFEQTAELPDSEWEKVAGAAGLTSFEQRVFLALYRDQEPYYTLHTHLRQTKGAVKKAYRSIQTKLFNQSAAGSLVLDRARNSRSVVFMQRLDSGRLVLSMGRLDDTFADVMAAENYLCLISEQDPSDSSANDENCWFSSTKVRRAFVITVRPVTSQDLDAEIRRLGINPDKDFGTPAQRESWSENARRVLAARNKLEAQEQEQARIHALHDGEFQAALSRCESEHRELMERVEGRDAADGQEPAEGLRKRIAGLRRESWEQVERLQPAALMSIDELGAALDKRAESGLKAAIKELDKLEAELNSNAETLAMLREEASYRKRQAQVKAANKDEAKIVKAIAAATEHVDGVCPQFSSVRDATERVLMKQAATAMVALKAYQARKQGVSV